MTKHLILWQVNANLWPTSAEEGLKLQLGMLQLVKEDVAKGLHKDFGMSADGSMGYLITELSEKEIYANIMRFQPYIQFQIHAIISADELGNILQAAIEMHKK